SFERPRRSQAPHSPCAVHWRTPAAQSSPTEEKQAGGVPRSQVSVVSPSPSLPALPALPVSLPPELPRDGSWDAAPPLGLPAAPCSSSNFLSGALQASASRESNRGAVAAARRRVAGVRCSGRTRPRSRSGEFFIVNGP